MEVAEQCLPLLLFVMLAVQGGSNFVYKILSYHSNDAFFIGTLLVKKQCDYFSFC